MIFGQGKIGVPALQERIARHKPQACAQYTCCQTKKNMYYIPK